VLVNQSRNSSGEVKGEPVGVEYYRLRALEHYLNARTADDQQDPAEDHPKGQGAIARRLAAGEGDLAAPGELLDPSTVRGVSSAPILDQVPLMLVGRKGERSFSKVEQLSGRTVALTSASAAGPLIQQVNQQLALRKRPPIKVEWVDSTLAVEDVLEMVQAGIYHLTVVEQPIARRWARVMPRLRLDSRVHLGRRKPCAGMCGVMRRIVGDSRSLPARLPRAGQPGCRVRAHLPAPVPGAQPVGQQGPPAPGLGAPGAAEACRRSRSTG
jgi:membrane-bound lytic murein transglycosylase MltF